MDDRELLSIVDEEFTSAMGAPGGEISTERARAWNYYLSKPRGDEEEGQSQVVTTDVADVVDGIMPSLLRVFTTPENLIAFDAVGREDVAQAQQESDYVSHVFFKQNPAFDILHTWFFDGLSQKNGIVKAWYDESEAVTTESYRGLTGIELAQLLDDPELEPVERAERDPEPGEIPGDDGLVHDIEFRRVERSGRFVVDNVPVDEYRISSDARKLDPSSARMVGQERAAPRTELLAMGFPADVVDRLPAYASGDPRSNEEELSRYDRDEERRESGRDHSMELVLLRECYMRVDYDGDGRAELRQIISAGGQILSNEPVDRQPFHVICPHPLPHKHFGQATAEKVMDVQDVTTTLERQMLMNLYHTNNPGHAVYEMGMGENTYDDLLTTRVGGIKRFARPVGESYAPITVPFTAAASFPMLEHYDRVKRERTGVASDAEGLSPDALKNIQQSVMAQASDMSRMKIEAIARIFAETGIKSLFQHLRELLMKHSKKADVVQLRGEWVEVDPRDWKHRRNVTVNIGLGIGSRDTNLMHIQAVLELQARMIQAGGMNLTVTPKNVYNAAAELVKNANLKGDFFTDPGDKQAPPPSQEQEQLQRQQQELVQRQQELDAQQQAVREAKVEIDRQRLLLDTEQKLQKFAHEREMDIARLMLDSQELRTKMAQAQSSQDLDELKVRLDAFFRDLDRQTAE